MLALCLMLLGTYYALNYASIISRGLLRARGGGKGRKETLCYLSTLRPRN